MRKTAKIQNIVQLRDSLIGLYNGINDGSVEVASAKQQVLVAGKIINSAKVQIEYNSLMDYKRKIDFLEV